MTAAERFWVPAREWAGETVCIIASGPSLTAADVAHARAARAAGRCRLIVINREWEGAPDADLLYACDESWWRANGGVPAFRGIKAGLNRNCYPDVRVLRSRRKGDGPEPQATHGLSDEPGYLREGRNSGYQAIDLACQLGAARIALLGFDCKLGRDGRRHHFGDHPRPLSNPRAELLARWVEAYRTLALPLSARRIEVINCSRDTAIDAFPRSTIQECL